jgi:hypothetical protein
MQLPDNTIIWISPTGQVYIVYPDDYPALTWAGRPLKASRGA